MPIPARRVATFGTTIFTEINMLAQQYNALNLGQGKPDFDAPPDVIMHLVQAAQSGQYNQYAPGPGTLSLRQAVVDHAKRFYKLEISPAPTTATSVVGGRSAESVIWLLVLCQYDTVSMLYLASLRSMPFHMTTSPVL